MDEARLWKDCVSFHGHECPGLTIGYKAALLVAKAMNSQVSRDEELVCVSENDACGVDAIQVILGCTVGKGNLLFHLTGKQSYTFFQRSTGESMRLILKTGPEGMDREQKFNWLHSQEPDDLFDLMPARLPVPEYARILKARPCFSCGELTSEQFLRLQKDMWVCLDCWTPHDRFTI